MTAPLKHSSPTTVEVALGERTYDILIGRDVLASLGPRIAALEAACVDADRDPATIGKSAGIVVEPTSVTGSEAVLGTPMRGSAEEIADALRAFGAAGFTNVEVVVWPPTVVAVDAMAPVLELLDAD